MTPARRSQEDEGTIRCSDQRTRLPSISERQGVFGPNYEPQAPPTTCSRQSGNVLERGFYEGWVAGVARGGYEEFYLVVVHDSVR